MVVLQASAKLYEILRGEGSAICRDPSSEKRQWLLFHSPERTLEAHSIEEVEGLLSEAWREARSGKWLAGFISYEAAPAFDKAMAAKAPARGFPLACFAVYEEPAAIFNPQGFPPFGGSSPCFKPECSEEEHCEGVREVLRSVDSGETYQIDLTLRLRAENGFQEKPWEAFCRLAAAHPTPHMGYFNMGGVQLCSLSPELFLERKGSRVATEPMKGTARRLESPLEDAKAALWLANDEKNRAENLMIVDMCRNDLGRICVPGSVKAPELFKVLSYPTVHQMVSRVEGLLPENCSLLDLLKASFPPASITGAPKIMAMKRIAGLERSPRKAYTGCAGCIAPDGDLLFNVAIRTIVYGEDGAELGVGGGIVADSKPEAEWDECMAKAAFASRRPEDFKVLETILWRREDGFQLLDAHIARAKSAQLAFGRQWIEGAFEAALGKLGLESSKALFARVRVLLGADGKAEAAWTQLEAASWGPGPLKALISACRTDASSIFLKRKTTLRKLYDRKFKEAHERGYDEALFLNGRGELAEGAISNIELTLSDGSSVTPAASCGLLEGLWRAGRIKDAEVKEAVLTLEELKGALEIRIGNSVRGAGELEEVWLEGEDGKASIAWRRPHSGQRR